MFWFLRDIFSTEPTECSPKWFVSECLYAVSINYTAQGIEIMTPFDEFCFFAQEGKAVTMF